MNYIKYIFEATSRTGVLKRFVKYIINENVYNLEKHQSASFYKAISCLNKALETSHDFSASDIKDACGHFAKAEQCKSIYGLLHAKFGQLICHYLLGNKSDVESLVQEILNTTIPRRRNIKGLFVNIGKGLITGAGVVVSFIPPARMTGVAMTHYARSIPTEELTVLDAEINRFIIDMREVDFNNVLNSRHDLE